MRFDAIALLHKLRADLSAHIECYNPLLKDKCELPMNGRGYSPAAIALFERGPFPGRIDPWAEDAHFFQPLHNELIGALMGLLRKPLLERGYVAGRETSLQIAEGREPDVFVHQNRPDVPGRWNYALAAEEVLAVPGVAVAGEADLEALHIHDARSGDLVTVVEIISPGNKTRPTDILAYQERRMRLYVERGVNVVELDFTRSVKRLTYNSESTAYPYHVALLMPGLGVRVIGILWGAALPRVALPLRAEVQAVELQEAYATAYRQTNLAWHIRHERRYTEDDLPFPTLLSGDERDAALAAVTQWDQALLAALAL